MAKATTTRSHELTIKRLPIGKLKPAPYNPRKDLQPGDPEYEALKRSMDRWDVVEPIVWNKQTGHVVGGHQRLKVLKARGDSHVDVSVVDLSPSDEKALNVALNKIGGDFDTERLAVLLAELSTNGFDATLTGFDQDEIAALLQSLDTREESPDVDLTPPANPKSRLGEVYQLGRHRVMCGDSTQPDDVAGLMMERKAGLVFTDPPYGVDYDGGTTVREKLTGDTTTALYEPCCKMAAMHSTSSAALYLWHAGVKGIAAAAAAAAAGYTIRCEIVWNKNLAQFGALSAQYKQKHEPCYYCHKKAHAPQWFGPTNEVTVWDLDRAAVNEFHPTQKPVELAARAMRNSSAANDVVLDLFLGSGSTVIAAEQLGRTCYGMEIDPAYVDVIRRRYAEFVNDPSLAP